jgi:hypothetical protein
LLRDDPVRAKRDNRCTLHRATPFDKTKYTRKLHRTTIAGKARIAPLRACRKRVRLRSRSRRGRIAKLSSRRAVKAYAHLGSGWAPARTLAVDTLIMLPILVRSLFRCWCVIACVFGVREMNANLEELQR